MTVSTVMVAHNKRMEKNSLYRITINDERNEKIRDKVNATMTPIFMIIMGLVAIICFSIKE